MTESQKYYVYVHRYASGPRQGDIFYVGKGTGGRFKKTLNRNGHWTNAYLKYGASFHILFRSNDERQCLQIEKCIIRKIGISNLTNKARVGSKNSGWKHTEAWREAARKNRSGKLNPFYGRKLSDDAKAAISKSLTGRPSPKKGVKQGPMPEDQKKYLRLLASYTDERNPWLNSRAKPHKMKMDTATPIETACGLNFYGINSAVEWLRKNGWPKASHSAISLCCNPDSRRVSAYGYTWRKIDASEYE